MLGLADPAALQASGRLAGLKAAGDTGVPVSLTAAEKELAVLPGPVKGNQVAYIPGDGAGRKSFICFDEDGTLKAAGQSAEQGFDVPELAKRFGGFGLGPGQSGIPGHNLPLVMSNLRGESTEDLIPTTVRSPLIPVLMATVSGHRRSMHKRTPMHAQQEALGALFEKTGTWKRANRFSADAACSKEIDAVHQKAGMIDVSTLGKFRLYGPDAEKILQRVYISNISKVTPGQLKYSAMLNDSGMLLDDGVVTRVGENDYYFTTSSARADASEEWFRYHSRYEDWDFGMVNLTDHLAAINLAGPNSRKILAKLTEADLTNEAFPYMGYREIDLLGDIPVRALRVGFLGELSYELHFPASYGPTVWNLMMDAGTAYGLVPIGLEAQNVCRLEKGHVIIGVETEQRVNLLDLGLGFLWDRADTASRKVGSPALRFTEEQTGRMKLAGLHIDDGQACPGDGAIIVSNDSILGHVCTARKSAAVGKTIALALVHDSLATPGSKIHIYQNEGHGERRFTATVAETPFYDPEGQRLRR
jgi:sarcosine oxidase subunit alpha